MTTVASSNAATVTLPTDTQIVITRVFDAPKRLVYRAWTEPELVKRWWAGQQGTMDSAEVDLRVGGTWRFVMTATGGSEVAFHGEYRELVPDERIVSTEIYEGAPEAPALNTLTLTEEGGRTTQTIVSEYLSREHRDAVIDSGMEHGMQQSMNALEQVAQSLR